MLVNIIQIGCNNGQDHVYNFVSSYRHIIDKVLYVDASADSISLCKKQYQEFDFCDFLHSAVVTDDSKHITMYYPEDDTSSIHTSNSFDFLKKHNHYRISQMTVPAININCLLAKFNQNIDRLYIDTEGLDIQIINAIDMNQYIIPFIFFEYTHSDGVFKSDKNFQDCQQRLISYNYKLFKVDEYNAIAIL